MKNEKLKKLMCMFIATVMLFTLSGCLGESEPTKESYQAEEETAKSEEKNFGLNETAVFDSLKITATEIKESAGEQFFEPESGNVFLGVNFTIENISDEEQTISSLLLFDAYADDVSCDYSISAAAAYGSQTLDGALAPGKKLVGWYTVEVPQGWNTLELQVKADWLSSVSATFVFNK